MWSLNDALARSLGPALSERASAIASWMRAADLDGSALEASVRARPGAPVVASRMMVEGVPPSAVAGFFEAIGAPQDARASALVGAADALSLPAIVGWATDAAHTWIKVYANASDKGAEIRRQLGSSMGLREPASPHVVGLNIDSSVTEMKVYSQSAAAPALDAHLAKYFAPLSARSMIGGWVTSVTVTDAGPRPRAVFAALRAGHPEALATLHSLPGWPSVDIDAAAPFPLGPIKSLGVDLNDPERLTVYFKPAGTAPEGWALEPVLIASDGSSEIGLFVEPSALGRRSYAHVGPYALSYRVRAGAVDAASLRAFMRWVEARIVAGVDPSALAQGASPPSPWSLGARERA